MFYFLSANKAAAKAGLLVLQLSITKEQSEKRHRNEIRNVRPLHNPE